MTAYTIDKADQALQKMEIRQRLHVFNKKGINNIYIKLTHYIEQVLK